MVVKVSLRQNPRLLTLFSRCCSDPDRTYGYYDLSKDAAKLLADLHLEEIPGFSVVKHYPPEQEQQKEN